MSDLINDYVNENNLCRNLWDDWLAGTISQSESLIEIICYRAELNKNNILQASF